MPDRDQALLHELRVALVRLNDALGKAQAVDVQVELKIHEQGIVGRSAPLLRVSGRAIRARVELDERL